jgi:hypothetical protein
LIVSLIQINADWSPDTSAEGEEADWVDQPDGRPHRAAADHLHPIQGGGRRKSSSDRLAWQKHSTLTLFRKCLIKRLLWASPSMGNIILKVLPLLTSALLSSGGTVLELRNE